MGLFMTCYSDDVTHIVTEFDTIEPVLRKLGLAVVEDLGSAQVVKVKWFTDCMKAGHVIDVEESHKVAFQEETRVIYLRHTLQGNSSKCKFTHQ